jgi:serine/threonine protein kinase
MPRARDETQVHVPRVKDDDAASNEARTKQAAPARFPGAADDTWSGLRQREMTDGATLAESPPGYQILTPVGQTAYGRAFRARHIEKGREVALHFLTIDEERARDLSLAVAKVAQLSQGNVIALEDHGRLPEEGSHYLVTEALDGTSLSDLLEDVQTLSLSRALTISSQVVRALRTAHKLGIVHGELSPANVRLSKADDVARVVGFGCTAFRSPKVVAVTPPSPYAAPETQRGLSPDVRSDIFSVGCLVYRMLTGKPPKLTAGEPPPSLAASSAEPVPRELDELVSSCLEAQPEARLGDTLPLTRKLREITRSHGDEHALAHDVATASSVPPAELPPEGETSGSFFGGEGSGGRTSYGWIIIGLALALLAVWFLWNASVRIAPEHPSRPPEAGGALPAAR